MSTSTRLSFKDPSSGLIQTAPIDDLDVVRERAEWIWLDVSLEEPEVAVSICERFGFDRIAIEDVTSRSEYPKVDDYSAYLFLVTHALGQAEGKLTTVELDAFLGADYLVTFHWEPIPAVEWILQAAGESEPMSAGGPDRLLARICEMSVRRFLPLIEGLENRIETLEDAAMTADPSILGEVQALRRDLLVLRKSISPQRELFSKLREEWTDVVGLRARLRFGDVYDQQYRVVETLDTDRALLASILDTYRSSVAERMNEVMKVLTVFSAILLPLTMMAGLYGMNFANMPELQWRWGYFALLGLMATVATALWLYFARRGFIGGPRLDTVPRAVGRGLGAFVHLTLVPLNVVKELNPIQLVKDQWVQRPPDGPGAN